MSQGVMHAQKMTPATSAWASHGLRVLANCHTIHKPMNGVSDRMDGFIKAPKPQSAPQPIHSRTRRPSASRIDNNTKVVSRQRVMLVSHIHFTAQYMA